MEPPWPRPSPLFLVEAADFPSDPRFWLAWKEGESLFQLNAGFPRIGRPPPQPTGDSSAATTHTIARDFRATRAGTTDQSTFRTWDVSDRVGYHHPRIHRPEISFGSIGEPPRSRFAAENMLAAHVAPSLQAAITSSIAAAQLLFDDLDELLATIEPVPTQLGVFGHKPRLLLLVACMEVESALRSVLACNDAAMPQQPKMPEYRALAVPMQLSEWTVRLVRSTAPLEFTPFANWDPFASPRSLSWYQAHHATKHAREEHLDEARLEHVLNALAAVYVLLNAQFGPEACGRLRHRPFEIVREPTWSPASCYVVSPFDGPTWQSRPRF